MTDLDHLYALADGATAGPWVVEDGSETQWIGQPKAHQWLKPKVGNIVAAVDGGDVSGYTAEHLARQRANAAYIAALSPDVVKGLIERVRAAEKALALLPPADGWRSIDTAPNGETVLMAASVEVQGPGAMWPKYCVASRTMWVSGPILGDWCWGFPPTHWRPIEPLPAPPAAVRDE